MQANFLLKLFYNRDKCPSFVYDVKRDRFISNYISKDVRTMSSARGHISEIHILRAIGCLFVVAVHVSGSFYYAHGQQYNEWTLFINQISRFGTPMFALISGFLLFYQTRNRGFNFKKFTTSRFTKIGLPFLFWSSFYLLFTYCKR